MWAKGCSGWWIVPLLLAISCATASAEVRLVEAVKKADRVAVRALLKQGADVNVPEGDGATALHWAAYLDDQETADLLIRARATVNAANDLGVTPLWVACTKDSVTMISRLLKAGADPNAAPSTGGTPLMIASRTGNAGAVKLLLEHGADVNAKEGARGQTALMWAVAQRHPEVVRVLLAHRADVHARSDVWRQVVLTCCPTYNGDPGGIIEIEQGGFTPLLFAAQQGDIDSAKPLVAAGANVNDVAPDGMSVLVLAAHSGVVTFVEFLLEKGADPNAASAGYTALHAAVLRGNLDLAKTLLAHGVNPDVRLTKGTPSRRDTKDFAFDKVLIGATPFLLAAEWGELSFMRVLAASGADPLAVMKDGTTALIAAVRHGEYERFGGERKRDVSTDPKDRERLMLEAADLAIELGVDVDGADQTGATTLHLAAYKRSNSIIQFLADRGAALDLKNKKGQTPLTIVTMGRKLPTQGGFVFDPVAVDAAVTRDKITADLLRKLGAQGQ